MSRVQKKCLLASFGGHVLLILAVVFGAAFQHSPKPEVFEPLKFIPDEVVENALGGGGNPDLPRTEDRIKGDTLLPTQAPPIQPPSPPTPPVPIPATPTPTPPVPTPPTPKPPVAKPPEPRLEPVVSKPAPTPRPTNLAQEPLKLTPVNKAAPKLELRPVEATAASREQARREAAASRAEAAAAAAARRNWADRVGRVVSALRTGFQNGTVIDVGGPGGKASASYAQFVEAAYRDALQSRRISDLSDRDYTVRVEVVIDRSGAVVSSRLLRRSGNATMDSAVQGVLNSVRHVGTGQEFRSMSEPQRKFVIEYEFRARSGLG